mgnify:CR=1 FL=1
MRLCQVCFGPSSIIGRTNMITHKMLYQFVRERSLGNVAYLLNHPSIPTFIGAELLFLPWPLSLSHDAELCSAAFIFGHIWYGIPFVAKCTGRTYYCWLGQGFDQKHLICCYVIQIIVSTSECEFNSFNSMWNKLHTTVMVGQSMNFSCQNTPTLLGQRCME